MPAYIIATVEITDPQAFAAYSGAIAGLAERHNGRYVVRGAVTEQLEGPLIAGERIVVLEFPSADDARQFYFSETYQAAKRLREGAARLAMRLVVT